MSTLVVQTLKTSLIGLVVFGAVLFLPAGTFAYWQGWLFLVVFTISTQAIGIYLYINDPKLLAERQKIGPAAEQNPAQKIISFFFIVGSFAILAFCAFDYRFGWSPVPPIVSMLGDVLVALGLLVDFFVFKENSFGASTVKTTADQKVISSGPYALVRHPMYVGVLIMIIGVPLALDSLWGLVLVALYVPVLIWRILDEEALLKKDLPGYLDYTQHVHYRLVPGLW